MPKHELNNDIEDKIAALFAEMDQAQATISEARILHTQDQIFQLQLDQAQSRLNLQRSELRGAVACIRIKQNAQQ